MKWQWLLVALAVLVASGCAQKEEWDKYATGYNFTFIVSEKGLDVDEYLKQAEEAIKQSSGNLERAELLLIMGRVKNDKSLISFALDFFHKAEEELEEGRKPYEKALLYETIASIDDTKYNQLKSAEAWRRAKDWKRAMMHFNFATGKKNIWQFDSLVIKSTASFPKGFSEIRIGGTEIKLGNNDLLVGQANNAAMMKELESIGLKHETASGALVKELDGRWYAPNEERIFMFEVPLEKVIYPTTRFLQEGLAVIAGTGGISMIVEQAVKKNATAVMGGCDSLGDAQAARYLSIKGVKVICISDRYASLLIGEDTSVIGAAAFSIENGKAVFGNRPIIISRNEPVIAMDTVSKIAGMEFYDTPARYFSELEKKGAKLDVFIAEADDFSQMHKVIKRAKEKKANVIAVAVLNEDDYNKAKAWLEENPEHKAILFASEASPFGYKIAREFRSQTSFGDLNPVVK